MQVSAGKLTSCTETTGCLLQQKTEERNFAVGVLVLLPLEHNKLAAAWQGPYDVIEVLTGNNYRVRARRKEKGEDIMPIY